jgi:MraZ protein
MDYLWPDSLAFHTHFVYTCGCKWEKVEDCGAPELAGVLSLKDRVERMFLGRYRHNLDEKGRLIIPVRFRDVLNTEGAFVLQGFDHNLMVLTQPVFEAISRRVNQMSLTDPSARLLKRLIFSTADRVEVDRAGRILIPQFLRQAAGLSSDAYIVGAGDYFEIWAPDQWTRQTDQLQDVESNAQRFLSLELSSG